MTRHVSNEAVVDLAEGLGSEPDRTHVAGCGSCTARVEEMRAGLSLAGSADVPEPSPLYWEAMRRSVGRRIAQEARPSWRRDWLAPLAAAAALVVAVVALTVGRSHAPSVAPEPTLAAWFALPPAEDDASLQVLEGLAVADGDLGALDEGRGAGAFVASLSEEESRALAESLRGAGQGGES